MPAMGPGSGFPPRSGLAGLQPNSYAGPPTHAPGAGIRGGLPEEKNVAQMVRENTTVYGRKYQAFLDRSTPHVLERWLATLGLFILFGLNVIFRQGVSPVLCLRCSSSSFPVVICHSSLTPENSGTLSATPWQSTCSTSSWPSCSPASTPHSPTTWPRTKWRKAPPVFPDQRQRARAPVAEVSRV